MSATCVGHHRNDPPLSEPGLLICRHCLSRLRRDISDIEVLWGVLADLAVPGRTGTRTHGKRVDPPAPCNLDVLDVRDPRTSQIVASMGWARVLVEDRRLSSLPGEVNECASLLLHHIDWVAAQEWIDEAADEIHQAAGTLRRISGETPPRPVGLCNSIDASGRKDRCGGPLHWIDGTTTVRCASCGDTWGEADLPHLLRVDVDLVMPVDWMSRTYGIPERTLRRWVASGLVRRAGRGLVRYGDVMARLAGST